MNWGSQFVVDGLLLEHSTSRNYDDLVQPVLFCHFCSFAMFDHTDYLNDYGQTFGKILLQNHIADFTCNNTESSSCHLVIHSARHHQCMEFNVLLSFRLCSNDE